MLQTDRLCYVSGDYLFFKSIIIDKEGDNINDLVLYVDIVDRNKQFINGEILRMKNGLADGFIQIPDSIRTGYYWVRSYTYNSMHNSTQRILDSKQIYVTNRFGNNSEQFEGDSFVFLDTSVEIPQYKEVNNTLYTLDLTDSIYSKRKKVGVNIEREDGKGHDILWAALSVKQVTSCEQNMANLNFKNPTNTYLSSNKPVLANTKNKRYLENKGMIVSGHVTHNITGNPLPNILLLLAFEDSINRLKYCITDKFGSFSFLLTDCYEEQMIFLSAYSYPTLEIYPQANIVIESKFLDKDTLHVVNREVVGYESSNDTANVLKAIIAKSYRISYFDSHQGKNRAEISYESVYLAGNITSTVYIDDYIDLPDFIEITREILPFARLRKHGGKYVFSTIDGLNNTIRENPMIIVDGVPLTDINTILPWGTSKIKKVEVQVEPRYFGDVGFESGIILISTKKMDFWSNVENKNTYIYSVPCFQKPIVFSFPNYAIDNFMTNPDFRQILFWEPNIVLNTNDQGKYEFYTSDEAGLYEVVLSGFTSKKEPIYIQKYFKVK
jgi:hypothetical protein